MHVPAAGNQSCNVLHIAQIRNIQQEIKTVGRRGLYKNSHSQLELQTGPKFLITSPFWYHQTGLLKVVSAACPKSSYV